MRISSKNLSLGAAALAAFLVVAAPSSAQDATLLVGCQVMLGGGGVEVVFADSSAPIPAADGVPAPASSLVGLRCPTAMQRLLDDGLISPDQLAASANLVINSERRTREQDGGTTDIPDCIIWDIDSADVTRMQLVCDPTRANRIVVQDSANGRTKNYIGWKCADALADLGGLANVARTSVIRPPQAPIRVRSSNTLPPQPGSIFFYQLTLNLP